MLSIMLFWGTYFGGVYAALTRAPVFAFMVYQAVYFYNPPKRWWGDSIPELSYSFYMVVLMVGLLALNWEKLKHNKLLEVPQTKWIYLFLILHLIASMYAALPFRHELFTTYFFKLVVTISIAYKLINTRRDLYLAISGYVFGAWYLSFYTFQVGRNSGDRVEGIGTVDSPDANGIAATLTPAVVFGIYYLWRSPNWKYRILSLFILAFLCNALVLINSRGAVLGVAVGGIYLMYELYKSKLKGKYQKTTVLGLCFLGLVGLSVVVDDTFIERFTSIKEESAGVKEDEETGSSRIVYWLAAYDLALDHPFGTGAYGFNYYSAQYIPETSFVGRQLRKTGGYKSVHSSWFSALAEVGFPGLFALLMIFLSCYHSAKKMKKYLFEQNKINDYYLVSAMQGALLSFAITMVFLDRHRAEVLYWLILFFMAAHNLFLNKKIHSNDHEIIKESSK